MEANKKKIPPAARILIMLLVLAVAIGAYAGIRHYNSTHDKSSDGADKTEIYSVDADKITQMKYTLGGVVYTFDRADSKSDWTYSEDTSLSLDQDTVDSMASTAAFVSTKKVVQDNLDNSSEYGFDSPTFTLTITLSDGSAKTVTVGSENSVTSEYYAYVDGDNRIFTIDSDFLNSFTTADNLSSSDVSSYLNSSDSSY